MAAVASERRRDRLGRILRESHDPVTGSELAKRLGVSTVRAPKPDALEAAKRRLREADLLIED